MTDLSEAVRKPAGNIRVIDPDSGKERQGDTLQCCHCGSHWLPSPGSGKRRGYCLKHAGPLCGQPGCVARGCRSAEQMLEELEFLNFTPPELLSPEQVREQAERIAALPAFMAKISAPTRL